MNISTLDLAVLMYNVYRSTQEFEYNDIDVSLDELILQNNPMVKLRLETVEKFLYCSNLLDEKGKFWHPSNKSFEQFLDKQLYWPEFDLQRNYFVGLEEN